MKITFILGAGASSPYEYPLGAQLKGRILEEKNDQYLIAERLSVGGNSREVVHGVLERLSTAEFDTIDEFISEHRADPWIPTITKQAIALLISDCEDRKILFGQKGTRWYRRLLDFLRANPEMAHRDNLSILTFNYDRSLEHYLHESIESGGRSFSGETVDHFLCRNFLHLHGNVGFLPWQTSDRDQVVRAYGAQPSPAELKKIADNILAPYQELTLALQDTEALLASDVVVIMGFGFHSDNLEKIHFSKLAKSTTTKVCVTVQALSTDKCDLLKSSPAVTAFGSDCFNFLNNFFGELESCKRNGKMAISDEWLNRFKARPF